MSSSYDKTARLWTSRQNRSVRIFGGEGGHTDDVNCSIFSPDALMVFTGSNDKKIKIWDVGKGRKITELAGHDAAITAMAISSDGRYFASGDMSGAVLLWEISYGERPQKIKLLKTSNEAIVSMCFSKSLSKDRGDKFENIHSEYSRIALCL